MITPVFRVQEQGASAIGMLLLPLDALALLSLCGVGLSSAVAALSQTVPVGIAAGDAADTVGGGGGGGGGSGAGAGRDAFSVALSPSMGGA